jgi:hypothetical protein
MTDESVKPLPFFFVGKTVTNDRVKAFMRTKLPLLSEAIGKPDTQSIWYSKEHVQGWLDEMNHAGADGLRIYFGSYDSDHATLSNQLCLLMVMTALNTGTGGHKDISIEDASDFANRSALARSFTPDGTKRDFNVGSPCPPVCLNQEPGFPD